MTHNTRSLPARTLALLILALVSGCTHAAPVQRVILISVDGLRPDAVTTQGPDALPNFYRMRAQGAFTDNARTDYDLTVTLPNHTCMITGRGVEGDAGHHYTHNGKPDQTIHQFTGAYVASMFDVAHDAGLSTSLFASKGKFSVYDESYDEDSGAENGHGKDKIDDYFSKAAGQGTLITARPATRRCIQRLNESDDGLIMLHLLDPDATGHADIWMGEPYLVSIRRVDQMLGRVLDAVEANPDYADKTVVILTADHGGIDGSHGDPAVRENYTVPFYVWGAGVPHGADLYQINQDSRKDPGDTRPDYTGPQPIRNGDAANLALSLLGLPPVPGSTINADQSLKITD